MKRVNTWIAAILWIPYLLCMVSALLHYHNREVTDRLLIVAVFISTPGLLIVGIILCLQSLTVEKIFGALSIAAALCFTALMFYALVTGL